MNKNNNVYWTQFVEARTKKKKTRNKQNRRVGK